MTWLDGLTLAFIAIFVFVEVKRGAVCAIIDTVGVSIALKIATASYQGLASASFSLVAAYLTVFLVLAAAAIAFSTVLQMQLRSDLGPFDSTVAGCLGVFVGLCFAHIAFGASILHFGPAYKPLMESVFVGQVYRLEGLRGFLDFMGRIGTTDVAN